MEALDTGYASRSGPGVVVMAAGEFSTHQSEGRASVRGIRGFEAKDYADIDWLWFQRIGTMESTQAIAGLLFPFADTRPDVRFEVIKREESSAHLRVAHPDGVDDILINPIKSGEFALRGDCAVLSRRASQIASFAAAKTLTLSVGGKSLVNSGVPCDAEGNF
jgi:hypothetical protein